MRSWDHRGFEDRPVVEVPSFVVPSAAAIDPPPAPLAPGGLIYEQ
jgi:hypothetical protein